MNLVFVLEDIDGYEFEFDVQFRSSEEDSLRTGEAVVRVEDQILCNVILHFEL
jgi:hypothetical protein